MRDFAVCHEAVFRWKQSVAFVEGADEDGCSMRYKRQLAEIHKVEAFSDSDGLVILARPACTCCGVVLTGDG